MNNPLDINADCTVALRDVPDLLPRRRGKKVHNSTVYRWVTKGARGRVLESQLIGGVRYTSVSALNRFLGPTRRQADDDRRAAIRQVLYGDT